MTSPDQLAAQPSPEAPLSYVCITSNGCSQALGDFLATLPADSGSTFLLFHAALPPPAALPVLAAVDGMPLRRGTVVLLPPTHTYSFSAGRLQVSGRDAHSLPGSALNNLFASISQAGGQALALDFSDGPPEAPVANTIAVVQPSFDLEALLDSTGTTAFFLDAELRILRATPFAGPFATLASFRPTVEPGSHVEELLRHLGSPALLAELVRVQQTGQPVEQELSAHDGSWLRAGIHPLRSQPGGLVLTLTAIAPRESHDRALLQFQTNFSELAKAADAIFWLTSSDCSTIFYVSPGYERLWKRSLESLCENPQTWLDSLHPADRAFVRSSLAERLPDREWEATYRVLLPDGSARWIRDRRYPVRDSAGNAVRLAGISLDVTGVTVSRRRLEFAQFAIDNAGDMVFWVSRDGRILYANNAAGRALGYSRDQLLELNLGQIDLNRPPEVWSGFIQRLLDCGAITFESTFRTATGQTFPVEITSTCLRFDSEVFGYSVARDISQRKQSERDLARYATELEQANTALRRQNRELDEFAYFASHDLKEPLRVISTFSTLLSEDLGHNLSADARRDLDYITGAAGRMQRLVTDLLTISRAGRAEMKPVPVNLRGCVDAALQSLTIRINESKAKIRVPDRLPTVLGDPTMLTQLFQNLLSNALKFSPPPNPLIEVTAVEKDGLWTFGVRDNGIGISSEHLDKIFLPFRRVRTQSAREGTGIGLAICRTVVERHEGRIWVETQPGSGSHFLFTLGSPVLVPQAALS